MIAPDRAASARHAWIALGANLGDRRQTLRRAIELLHAIPGVSVLRQSSFIETEPVGGPAGQPKFLNGAAALETTLSPRELLNELLLIENNLGRERSSNERNLPRTIDLDLLIYENEVVNQADLVIPHPRMHERTFVLAPLVEIAPDLVHPILKTDHQRLERVMLILRVQPSGKFAGRLHVELALYFVIVDNCP